MKFLKYFVYSVIALALVGCSKDSIEETSGVGAIKMKTVTISSGIEGITRASVDSQTGAFAWQSGDLISVLATDGNFYDFIINDGEAGKKEAEFTGNIPETANVTTVATYPRIVSNGSANTVLEGSTLNYYLPATWTYAKDVSNVPMVAAFDEAAEDMSFKQVGGVMRFPVKNLPAEAKFVLSMNKTITGSFPVNISSLGESAMVAGETASTLTINYTSDVDGASAEFNVPVPTGVYSDFTVEILGANDEVLFTKEYANSYEIKRATLFNMKELVLEERPMAIAEVWPFFVDARVVFGKCEADAFAFYIDGAETPVIVEAEDLGDKFGALIGGEFKHNTTHSVAVAKVIDGQVVADTKSEAIEFTTADVYQLTTNTGTKFVTAGWDDVAIANGTKFDNGKWSVVNSADYPDVDAQGRKLHQKRGYQVQLLAADKQTVIYDMIPFDGHSTHQNAFYDSNTLGKISGNNILTPTALAFGHLEPGKDYYFRVKTLDEVVNIDFEKGNYIAEGNTDKPYPYPLSSERGGCAWSELVKFSTDPVHTPSANEIFHEGFDDIMISFDYVNWAAGVVPDLETTKRQGWSTYVNEAKTAYPAFLKKSAAERKWTVHCFNQRPTVVQYGMLDNAFVANSDNILNANAGSMQGWSLNTSKVERNIFPMFGAIAIGQAINNHGGSSIATPAINSDKLLSNLGTKCIVTIKVSNIVANKVPASKKFLIAKYKDGSIIGEKSSVNVAELCPEEWNQWYTPTHTDANNYINHQHYYEVKHELYLRKGESIWLEKYTEGTNANKEYGWLIFGDIKVEIVPGEYEQTTFVDNGIGTEPDDTNYDVYGLGKFPISYWYNIPTAAHNYDPVKTYELYKDMADSGINIVNYYGELDHSLDENIRIMNVCTELGMKFIGQVGGYATNAERIAAIKQNLATSSTYVGEYLVDEPSATTFNELGAFTKEYLQEIPNKEVYVNLYPMYAKATALGTSSYERHILEYLDKVPTKSLSFDYYGLRSGSNSIASDFYTNIDLVRDKTLAKKMPFWVITQAGQVGPSTRMPNEKEQRWTVWSNIAGGSKGIAYFCYWSPWEEVNDEDMHARMIKRDGTKTEMYYWVQQINADIETIGKKLLPCHADGMILSLVNSGHRPFTNNGQGRTKYGPIQNVSAKSEHVLCGCFRDARISENGDNYKGYKALIVAERPTYAIRTELTLDTSVTSITVTQNNTTKVVELNNLTNVKVIEGEQGVNITYTDGKLTLDIPEGEALLIEF
ncbi:MAG: hypothetical protein J6V27_00415 [Alistipes sp.]|nr:hypothetical protein [Alistipes sp.]